MLFDLPHVVERARGEIAAGAVADRCEVIAGSFFDKVPGGADAYLLKHVIHDWDDERATAILKQRLLPGGRPSRVRRVSSRRSDLP